MQTSLHRQKRRRVSVALLACLPAAWGALEAQDYVLHLRAPSVELTTGSEFDVAVLLDTVRDDVQGWSYGIAHDGDALELLSVVEGPTTEPSKDGGFFALDDDPFNGPGFTFGIILSFNRPIVLPAATDQLLATARYRVLVDPTQLGEPCESVVTTVAFSDELGSPPVATVITVEGVGADVTIFNADITVRCPGTIEFTRCEGDTENVTMEWTFGGPPEWDFLFLYRDAEFLSPLEIDQTGYLDEGVDPGEHEYTIITVVVNDPSNPTLIFAQCTATVIPLALESVEPAIGEWVGGATLTITGKGFAERPITALELVASGEEPLPVAIVEVQSDTVLTATSPRAPRLGLYDIRIANERGSAELPDAFEYGFVRGEVNGQAEINIADPQFLLNFLFINPDPAVRPLCRDGADVNDDGKLDISDAAFLLNFLFIDGRPPPPPFPDPGQDPTTLRDPLGCLE